MTHTSIISHQLYNPKDLVNKDKEMINFQATDPLVLKTFTTTPKVKIGMRRIEALGLLHLMILGRAKNEILRV